MYAHEQFRQDVKHVLGKAVGKHVGDSMLTTSPNPAFGDLSSRIAFTLGRNPKARAEKLAKKMKPYGLVSEIRTEGPYINFYLDFRRFSKKVLKENYGTSSSGKGKTVIIEYSSPNIAKPFHLGHLRSTIIGQVIFNAHKTLGYKTISLNHIGDWGTQFGKLIVAWRRWGNKKSLSKDPIKELLRIYVKFHERESIELLNEARQEFKRLEEGDKEATKLWKMFYNVSIEKFEKVYKRLDVNCENYDGEAHYVLKGHTQRVIDTLRKKGLAEKESDGSIVIRLEKHGLTNLLISKSDEATLYATRELAMAVERYKKYRFSKNIYVVGNEQSLHFKQVFKTLDLMGYTWAENCIHVPFGLITIPGIGKMSTRKGEVIILEDVLDKAEDMAEKIIQKKNPKLPGKKKVAKIVGMGAIKFADLSQNRVRDISFDWDKILSFEGDTGPYLQYAYVRCNSILKRAPKAKADPHELAHPAEIGLLKKIAEYPEVIKSSAHNYQPHILANYLIDLVHKFSEFYEQCPVLKAESEGLKGARIELVRATKITLKNGLSLLGIETPERM
jgi:arginyl-tRNA synthetase